MFKSKNTIYQYFGSWNSKKDCNMFSYTNHVQIFFFFSWNFKNWKITHVSYKICVFFFSFWVIRCCHSMAPANYHTAGGSGSVGSDSTLPLRFPTRMFSGSSPGTLLPQPPPPPLPSSHQPYLYNSPTRPSSFPSYYPPPQASINDYYVGHVLGNPSQCSHQTVNYGSSPVESSSYTCIGAPVGHAAAGFGGRDGGGSGGRDGSQQQQRLDVPSSINRFQDGF